MSLSPADHGLDRTDDERDDLHGPPLAARAEDVHQAVDDLALIDRPLVVVGLGLSTGL